MHQPDGGVVRGGPAAGALPDAAAAAPSVTSLTENQLSITVSQGTSEHDVVQDHVLPQHARG